VDEIDFDLVPLGAGETGRKRVLARDCFLVVVRHRRAVVPPSEPVDRPGIEQQRREQLRLAGAAVAHERDVPEAVGVIDLHRQTSKGLPASSYQLPATSFSFQLPASSSGYRLPATRY